MHKSDSISSAKHHRHNSLHNPSLKDTVSSSTPVDTNCPSNETYQASSSLNDSQFDLFTPKRKKLHHRQLIPFKKYGNQVTQQPQQSSNQFIVSSQQQLTKNSSSSSTHSNCHSSQSSSYHTLIKKHSPLFSSNHFHNHHSKRAFNRSRSEELNSNSGLQTTPASNDQISLTHCNSLLGNLSSINIPVIKPSSFSSSASSNSLNSVKFKRILHRSDKVVISEVSSADEQQLQTTSTSRSRREEIDYHQQPQLNNQEEEQEEDSSSNTASSSSSDLIIPSSLVNYYEQQENNSSLANSFGRYLIYNQIPVSGDIIYCSFNWLMGQKNTSVLKGAHLANGGSPQLNNTSVQQQHNSSLNYSASLLNTSGSSSIGLNHSGHHSSSSSQHHHSILSNSSLLGSSNISGSTLHSSGSPINGNILGNSTIGSGSSNNQSPLSAGNQSSFNSANNSSHHQNGGGASSNVLWRSTANKNNLSNLNNNNNNNCKNTIYNECNELIGQRPSRLDTILDMPPVPHDVQVKHSWNPDDRSLNIFVKEEDPFTLHRHPVAQSTDCIRGRVGYTRGLHVFQIHWNVRQRGTHSLIGVCTIDEALHAQGYQALIGGSNMSWGWDISRLKLYHDIKNNEVTDYPVGQDGQESPIGQIGDSFLAILDMDEGTLAFMVDGQYLGVAFSGLKGKKLYLVVSAVWGHCEITMKYYGGLDPEPFPLKDICRRAIRMQLGKSRLHRIHKELMLPNALKSYLLYQDMKR